MGEDVIHVALPSDENYVNGLKVTAASLAVYAKPETCLHFHVLDGGIRDETFAGFTACLTRIHANVMFSRHKIDEATFASLPAWSGNRMTYSRLALPAFLPDTEHVIYTDTDVLWLAPVEELWARRKRDVMALVCRDGYPATERKEEAWFSRKGFPFQRERYFCGGVLLLNLRLMREEQVVQKTFAFLAAHPDSQFADQTAFNCLLHDRVEQVPRRWQILTRLIAGEDFDGPVVLHYGGDIPWVRRSWWNLLSDAVMLWHWFNDAVVLRQPNASARQYFTPWQRVYKRALFIGLTHGWFRRLFYGLCRVTGRGVYCGEFDETTKKIGSRRLRALRQAWSARVAGAQAERAG